MTVLVLNRTPYSELFFEGRCRVPVPPQQRLLVSTADVLRDSDPAEFPIVACADMYDDEQVYAAALRLAAISRPDRVGTTHELLMLTAARLREELGLSGQSVESALRFRDKIVMKRALLAAGCPGVPRFVEVDADLPRLPWQAGRFVVKSNLSTGSRSVRVVGDLAQLNQARRELAEPGTRVEVEEFVAGDVYHVDGVVTDGEPVFAAVSRYLVPPGEFRTVASRGSFLLEDARLRARITRYHADVVRALGLRDGVTHLEVFHTPDDRIMFCEIGARPGGGGICTVLRHAFGVDMITTAHRVQAGAAPLPITRPEGDGRIWGLIGYYPQPDTVAVPIDIAPLPADLGIERYFTGIRTSGLPEGSTDYAHKFIVSAPDTDEFHRRHAEITDVVKLYGWAAA